jgi:glycosyltransferase involved in cell wall biosynthesis
MSYYIFVPGPKQDAITGGERFYLEVCTYLEKTGNRVDYISPNEAPNIFRHFIFFNFFLFWQMKNYRHATLVVDFYYHPWCFLSVWAIKYLLGGKICVSARGIYFVNKGPLIYCLSWIMAYIMLKPADFLFANSEWTKKELIRRGAKNKRIEIVPPGVDMIQESKKAITKEAGDKIRLIAVANCVPAKGIDMLVEAVSMLPCQKYHLTIMGETKDDLRYFDKIEAMVKAKRLENNILFLGFLRGSEKRKQYENADIFVHPSRAEGFGIVLLEAMGFGLPIVANEVAAIPELVKNRVNGFLVPPDNPKKFSKAINALIMDKELREKMGKMNRSAYLEKACIWEEVNQRFAKELQNIV